MTKFGADKRKRNAAIALVVCIAVGVLWVGGRMLWG